METQMQIGTKVQATVANKYLNGKTGTITSIGKGVIPFHVTLDGDKHETDFAEKELRVLTHPQTGTTTTEQAKDLLFNATKRTENHD